jgi:hypothetical protein
MDGVTADPAADIPADPTGDITGDRIRAGEGRSPALALDGFSGPLDHLLALARAQQIDLARLSVEALVDQLAAALRLAGRKTPSLWSRARISRPSTSPQPSPTKHPERTGCRSSGEGLPSAAVMWPNPSSSRGISAGGSVGALTCSITPDVPLVVIVPLAVRQGLDNPQMGPMWLAMPSS